MKATNRGASPAPPAPCIVYGARKAGVVSCPDRSVRREYLGIVSHGGNIDTAQFRQAERRQLAHGSNADGSAAGCGQKTGEIATVRQATIDGDRIAYGSNNRCRLDQPSRQQGNALQHGAHHVTSSGGVVHADEKRHGLPVPIGRGKAGKGGHEYKAAANGRRSLETIELGTIRV
ncbi:hypothetical protein D3C86_1634240 [compost metagenome]